MGYCINQVDSKFSIEKENFQAAFDAALKLHNKDYDWTKKDWFVGLKTLDEVFDAWRWELRWNDDGDIVDICFTGEKLGDDLPFLDAIAPFVVDGSYIEMQGEDGALWRWVFKDKRCGEIYATITWDM